MRIAVVATFFLASATFAAAQNGANWSYEGRTGPLVWSHVDPSYGACNHGHEQSPVDIRGARLNKALQPIQFHYITGPVTIQNDGRGIEVQVDKGSYIVAGGVRYDLVDFEFHRPSEHTVKGKFTDMEVDLVHKSADGKLAILGVRLNEDRGNPNAVMATLWTHLPTRAGTSARVADMINAGGLIPADPGYWTYTGSELTPPCSEGVQWFVYEEPIDVSREQLRQFAALFRMNTRPIEDLHGRKIEANK
ncbi:MAG TPA: carbonic anhydrase family protein [Terracidiphilus sp.]|nr:carbonic anhydrase family protein [Terracidiphilus sp.]